MTPTPKSEFIFPETPPTWKKFRLTFLHRELRSQHAALEQAQMDDEDGTPPRKSLISQLKRAIAIQTGCRIAEVMCKALELAHTKPLQALDEAGVVNLVRFDNENEA